MAGYLLLLPPHHLCSSRTPHIYRKPSGPSSQLAPDLRRGPTIYLNFIAFERGALTTTANRGFVEHFFEQAAWYRTEVNFTQSGKSMYKSYLNFRINKTKPSVAGAAHELSTAPLIKFIQGDRAARKSKVDSGWWWVA